LTQDFKFARHPWMMEDLAKVGKPKAKGGLRVTDKPNSSRK